MDLRSRVGEGTGDQRGLKCGESPSTVAGLLGIREKTRVLIGASGLVIAHHSGLCYSLSFHGAKVKSAGMQGILGLLFPPKGVVFHANLIGISKSTKC